MHDEILSTHRYERADHTRYQLIRHVSERLELDRVTWARVIRAGLDQLEPEIRARAESVGLDWRELTREALQGSPGDSEPEPGKGMAWSGAAAPIVDG